MTWRKTTAFSALRFTVSLRIPVLCALVVQHILTLLTGRSTVSPEPYGTLVGSTLYAPEEIRLDTWCTQWSFQYLNGSSKDVDTRIGLNIGANNFIKPHVEVIQDGFVLEIKSELPSCRDRDQLAVVYQRDINTQMAIIKDADATDEAKNNAMHEISALNARKTAQLAQITADKALRKSAWTYGVYRVVLSEACEVEIPKKVLKEDPKVGKVLDIDLIVKQEKTYKGSEAVQSASPAKA